MIYRIVVLLVLMVGWAQAETQDEKLVRIAERVSEGVLSGNAPMLPEDVEQRVQTIVQALKADASVLVFERQAELVMQQKKEAERNRLWKEIQSNVIKGVLIALAFLIVSAVIRKIGRASQVDKHSSLVVVNEKLRTTPCVVSFSVVSEFEAARIGRSLVDARLAARVDVVPQRALNSTQNGTLLLVQTVKGRLKALRQVVKEHAQDASAISIPVLKGHADYLNWIADAADGRG